MAARFVIGEGQIAQVAGEILADPVLFGTMGGSGVIPAGAIPGIVAVKPRGF